ncbi:MAG: methyltransferase [Burkholderiaceae bacterium]
MFSVSSLIRRPGFSDWASRSLLLGWLVRRQARKVFDLMSGFVYTQTLLACEQLGWLEALDASSLSVDQLAALGRVDHDRALLLIRAASAVGLLRLKRDVVQLTLTGRVIAQQAGLRALIRHHQLFYEDLLDPAELLRNPDPCTRLRQFWRYVEVRGSGESDLSAAAREQTAEYSALMSATQDMIVSQVLASVRFQQTERLLDIGGGQGRFAARIRAHHPGMATHVFDLPGVTTASDCEPMGRTEGDFFRDAFPAGFQTVSLVRVLYDHPDDWVLRLLKKVRDYLAPQQGRLILAEPMSTDGREHPMPETYFGFYLLAMRGGRPRSQAELAALLRQAGFSSVQTRPTPLPMQCSVMEAFT